MKRGVRVGVVRKAMVTLTLLGPAAAFGDCHRPTVSPLLDTS
eukprot:COSAG06_NODE_64785_length_258_cov_1.295597_1_plen_41_part_10